MLAANFFFFLCFAIQEQRKYRGQSVYLKEEVEKNVLKGSPKKVTWNAKEK